MGWPNYPFKKVELNITFECNLRCANCNRLCNYAPLADPMTVDQVALMVKKLREAGKQLLRTKVVGGEPTIHPDFLSICEVLSEGTKDGTVGKVSINTNGTTASKYESPGRLPPNVRLRVSRPSQKSHLPVLWAPQDVGLPSRGPCKMPKVCGFSLDSRGWLMCSVGIPITRLFGCEHLYRPLTGDLPTTVWGVKEMCGLCIFSTNLAKVQISEAPHTWDLASPTWAKAMWDHREKLTRV